MSGNKMAALLEKQCVQRILHDMADAEHHGYITGLIKENNLFGDEMSGVLTFINSRKKTRRRANNLRYINAMPIDDFQNTAVILRGYIAPADGGKISVSVQVAASYYDNDRGVGLVCSLYDKNDTSVKLGQVIKFVDDTNDFVCLIEGEVIPEAPVDVSNIRMVLDTVTVSEKNDCLYSESAYHQPLVLGANTYELVKSFSFDHPKNKNDKSDMIKLAYDRDNMIPDYDYLYKYNYVDGKVNVWMPMQFTVEVEDGCSIVGLNKQQGYNLYIRERNQRGHMVRHYCNYPDDVEVKNALIKDGNRVKATFSFEENWKQFLTKVNGVRTEQDFYFTAAIDIRKNGVIKTLPMTYATGLIVKDDNPMTKACKIIFIQWGCIAKGSRVHMGDGSVKMIEDLRIGDNVTSADGGAKTIRNISYGREARLTILETKGGKRIRLTDDHPVFLADGTIVTARAVRKGDPLVAMNGMEKVSDEIANVYEEDYNDMVYNLSFSEPTKIIAEGFILGDTDYQHGVK
jgi:hypothetical protein